MDLFCFCDGFVWTVTAFASCGLVSSADIISGFRLRPAVFGLLIYQDHTESYKAISCLVWLDFLHFQSVIIRLMFFLTGSS